MRRVAILAAGVLAVLGGTAAPAGADSHGGHAFASCVSDFSSLSRLGDTGGALARTAGRGGPKGHEPKLTKGAKQAALAKAKGTKGGKGFRATIPVYFHVVTAGDEGAVSDAAIAEQIQVMNMSFAGFFGGEDTGFRFRLKKVDRTDNAAWHFAGPETPEELEMKRALRQGKPDELNLYATSGAGYLGWAYFPDIVAEPENALDGVVVWWGSLPGGPAGDFYSLGQTATHEVGHWLALWHTFDRTSGEFGDPGTDPNTWPAGACEGPGDEVEDTPMQFVPTGGCPEGKDSCIQPGLDPIHNFMDYSFDSCYEEFTAGQAERMQSQFLYWRDKGKYPRA